MADQEVPEWEPHSKEPKWYAHVDMPDGTFPVNFLDEEEEEEEEEPPPPSPPSPVPTQPDPNKSRPPDADLGPETLPDDDQSVSIPRGPAPPDTSSTSSTSSTRSTSSTSSTSTWDVDAVYILHHGPGKSLLAKRHFCDLCSKSFSHSSGLSRHRTTHFGLRYKCGMCARTFTRSDSLSDHMKRAHFI